MSDSKLLDITGADVVELVIRDDGKVVWVNVNGICCLRVCKVERVVLDDRRVEEDADERC